MNLQLFFYGFLMLPYMYTVATDQLLHGVAEYQRLQQIPNYPRTPVRVYDAVSLAVACSLASAIASDVHTSAMGVDTHDQLLTTGATGCHCVLWVACQV